MTNSMTGFARGHNNQPWGQLTCEIKSVNHRYLEAHIKLPDALKNLENRLRDTLKKSVNRGKFEIVLNLHAQQNENSLSLNTPLAKQLCALSQQIEGLSHATMQTNTLDILSWPGVLITTPPNQDIIDRSAIQLFDETTQTLLVHRHREGEALAQFIKERNAQILENIHSVKQLFPDVMSIYQSKLRNKLNDLDKEIDETRFHQEVIYTAQKYDIAEELDRLQAHSIELTNILNTSGAKGRRLDFLMQELNREANTLASKSISTEITNIAVDLKVLIEQMREQIQNIE